MLTTKNYSCDAVLGIFAKQPLLGQAKTRLAQGTSPAWALRAAEALLGDTLDRLAALPVRRVIAYAPAEALDYFSPWTSQDFALFAQGEGDLGERLQRFFRHHRRQGFSRIVVVGSDSPTLPIQHVEQAFRELESHETVIGPSFDGGYCLIGSGPRDISLFEGIAWSTSKVLEMTVQRLREANVSLALLPPWHDVDTLEDWSMLRGHVLAMRQARLDPGVPRIERLIHEPLA